MGEDSPMLDDQAALDISPQDFARLVHGAGDEEIRTVVHGLGTEAVLDRIFEQMVDRFVPEKARGPVLYMTGKLKVTGNPMVAAGVSSFFEPPQP
jgi:hypothetical protein